MLALPSAICHFCFLLSKFLLFLPVESQNVLATSQTSGILSKLEHAEARPLFPRYAFAHIALEISVRAANLAVAGRCLRAARFIGGTQPASQAA
jgi:hypothetical protein